MSDLFEYNMGIQGKDANAKSKVDEPEIDVPGEEVADPKAQDNDVKKELEKKRKEKLDGKRKKIR